MPSISKFLEARIAEDEVNAKRAAFGWGAEWESVPDNEDEWSFINAEGKKEMVGSEDADVIIHIAWHDPARVLAECAAKRATLEMYQHLGKGELKGNEGLCGMFSALGDVIQDFAAVHADHPDYDPNWAA